LKFDLLINKNSILSDLFDQTLDDVFPNDKIFTENHDILDKMGLLSQFIPSNMLLDRIKTFLSINKQNLNIDCWKLMNHVVRTLKYDKNEENREKMLNLKFLKAKMRPDTINLQWLSDFETSTLWSFNDLYSETTEQLVFRVCPIFDSQKIDLEFQKLLIAKTNDIHSTIRQFDELQNHWFSIKDNDYKKCKIGPELFDYLFIFLSWLNNIHLKEGFQMDDFSLPKNLLFLGFSGGYDYFNIENVAFKVKNELKPIFIELPSDMSTKYEHIMKKLGVQERMCSNKLIDKLNDLCSEYQNVPLNESNIELYINILKEIDNVVDLRKIKNEIYLPDTESVLRKKTELCFKRETLSWLNPSKYKIINERVPIYIATKLEIVTLQNHFVKNLLQGFSFSQQEPFIIRIRKLLESYPNFSILLKN
jgi:hypothetical protein